MPHLTLDIPDPQDLKLLLQLAERLHIRVLRPSHPALKPLRRQTDVSSLREAQNYTGLDIALLDSLIQELDIQEPVETLLEQLDA